MYVKINGKEYEVKKLNFSDMAKMESVAEDSIISVFQRQQVFVLATAFVADTVGCGRNEALRLCEQHILGGGSLDEIYKAFVAAVNESDFFKKLLGIEEKKSAKKKSEQTVE